MTDITDAELVRRLSALPEERVLDYFWLMVNEMAERGWLLKRISQVKIARPETWNYEAIREAHEVQRDYWVKHVSKDNCFNCRTSDRQLYFHHIVEVQNGGSNTMRNLVPLCFPCHQAIHPWLDSEPAGRRSVPGFMSISECVRDVQRRGGQERKR